MRVVVVGAGDVGTHIVEDLADAHDLAVVDTDPDRIEALGSSHDIDTVEGDGRSLDTLEAAAIRDADVVIASTDDDAVNVMVCGAAANVTDAFTIARVKSGDLFDTWQEFDDAFGVDRMLCVDRLTAAALVRTVALPGALATSTFVDEQVVMAEFEIDDGDEITNQRVEDADRFPALTFAGVLRDDAVLVPSGETVIEPGDRVVVIGSPSSVRRFATTLSPTGALEPDDDVIVIGGDEVGCRTAELFAENEYTPRLVEHDSERAAELENRLSDVSIEEGEATSAAFLREVGVGNAELVVSTLDDETNYLVSLLARRIGAEHTASVVGEREFVDLFEAAGVDVTVQPHSVVAGEITRATRGYTDEAAILERDSAEVLEITVERESALAGEAIEDVAHDLPDGFVIGAIVRDGSLTTPRGGTVVQVGDHVVVFADTDALDEIATAL
ncbi:Trk system potassium transporter TrkA [Halococcus saccharolyticus]|uniref:Potassium transporter peripheral membrane component n=1 Tax=Halococcus saccharolyticus DSM 5350 TaxID=1227455 RepID=M0MM29_9EURY|nr:Trk system potassium transporter TrkA [Halococcus saccharolyticus]EMA46721.1 potassium transporter peripheral membrane component [Halococcus saccharolyticus DSM 5350]